MIHTLEDLRGWDGPGTHLAVLGRPIAHSLSPRMQNAALEALAAWGAPEFAAWRYHKFDIAPEELPEALRLFHARGFRGLNLTLPHKVLALGLAASVAPSGERAGAVNTLVSGPDGWTGHNTDGDGFARALAEQFGIPLRGADVVLLGAGGSARAVASTALSAGCRSLHLFNRTAARLGELARLLSAKFPDAAAKIHTALLAPGADANAPDNAAVPDSASAADVAASGSANAASVAVVAGSCAAPFAAVPAGAVFVNCTALGLKPGDPSPVPANVWRDARPRAAFDIVYGTGETRFRRDALAAGVPASDGLPMLCWQGALALELWCGRPAPADVMARALR